MQDADIFGKDRCFHAERPADIAGQHVYLFGLDIEHLRDVGTHAEHALRSDMKRKAAILIVAESRARLHRIDDHAAVVELQPRYMRGLGKSRRDLLAVAIMKI